MENKTNDQKFKVLNSLPMLFLTDCYILIDQMLDKKHKEFFNWIHNCHTLVKMLERANISPEEFCEYILKRMGKGQ